MQFFLGFDNDIQKYIVADIMELLPEAIGEEDISKIEVYLSDVCTISVYFTDGSSFEIPSVIFEHWRIIQNGPLIFRR